MKVLFAIRDEDSLINSIIYKYQRDTNKKMSFKKVKNFTAIIRELQENKDYDRIIISDDIDDKLNKDENKNAEVLRKII